MKNPLRLLALTLILLGGLHSGLEAQTLVAGIWTGNGVGPEGDSFEVTFEVQVNGDTLDIVMVGPDGRRLPLTNIRFEAEKFLFTWSPGIEVNCVLSPVEGGGYSGPCTDTNGETGQIAMSPPAPKPQN
jgi:hypothetical protein